MNNHPSKNEFFDALYSDNESRIFNKRDRYLDERQWDVNQSLLEEECKIQSKFKSKNNSFTNLFIVGAPRSGTTLLSQILYNQLNIGALYNALAKYYLVPLVGLQEIQNIISKSKAKDFESTLGNTKGQFEPHEFGYFWQYWFNPTNSHELTEEELRNVSWSELNDKLKSYNFIQQKSLIVKSIVYTNFQILPIYQHIQNTRFIHIQRNPEFVIQSVFEARKKQYGDLNNWWSIKPRVWKDWTSLSPIQQIANQVIYTEAQIEKQLKQIPAELVMQLKFEDLLDSPEQIISRISEKFGLKQLSSLKSNALKNTNKFRLNSTQQTEIKEAILKAKETFIQLT